MHQRARKQLSCGPCRRSKLRCDREQPCAVCKRRAREDLCIFQDEPTLRGPSGGSYPSPPRGVVPGTSSAVPTRSVDPIQPQQSTQPPSQHTRLQNPLAQQQRTTEDTSPVYSRYSNILERPLVGPELATHDPRIEDTAARSSIGSGHHLLILQPSTPCCDYLVSEYFMRIAPLFDVLHGQTFQSQYTKYTNDRIQQRSAWFGLLLAVCSLAVNTLSPDDSALDTLWPVLAPNVQRNTYNLVQHLRDLAFRCLTRNQVYVHYNIDVLECLLVLIYALCHNEGVERSWALLGMALNMGIALRCNAPSPQLGEAEAERRKRCWAAILMLHTYQGMLYRDIDLSFLLDIKASMPAGVATFTDTQGLGNSPKKQPTHNVLMNFKLRLFRLSTKVTSHITGPSFADVSVLNSLEQEVAAEQAKWDSVFLFNGQPVIIDAAAYAHWCILQTYAHQIFLLIHRPFHHARSSHFREASRQACLASSLALLDIHQQLHNVPRLRCYRWLLGGMVSFNALHAAVAMASCLLDMSPDDAPQRYRIAFDAAVERMKSLKAESPVCLRAAPALLNLQSQLREHSETSVSVEVERPIPDDWLDSIDWFNAESFNQFPWSDGLNSNAEQALDPTFFDACL